MEMDSNEDLDSLFAGMDLMVPMATSQQATLTPRGDEASSMFSDMNLELGPPDLALEGRDGLRESESEENDGSKMSSDDGHNKVGSDDVMVKGASRQSSFNEAASSDSTATLLSTHRSIETILASYDITPSKPALSTDALGTKSQVRRKKRSMKIGYGREGSDEVDNSSTKVDVEDSNTARFDTLEKSVDLPPEEIVDHNEEEVRELKVETSVIQTSLAPSDNGVDGIVHGEDTIEKDIDNNGIDGCREVVCNEQIASDNVIEKVECQKDESPCSNEEVYHLDIPSGLPVEESLGLIKKLVAQKSEIFRQKVATLSKERKAAAQMRRQAACEVSKTSLKLKELEMDIESACEREDFETAEDLSESLQVAEMAKKVAEESFRAAEANCDAIALNMQRVFERQVAVEEEAASLLKQLGLEAADLAEKKEKEAEDNAKRELKKQSEEMEAMDAEKLKLVSELKKVKEAKEELTRTIDGSIEPEVNEKAMIMDKRQVIVNEIEILMAKLREKEEELANYDKHLSNVEEKIRHTQGQFEKKVAGFEEDITNLTSKLQKLEAESECLIHKEQEIEETLFHAKEEKKKLAEFAVLTEKEADSLQDAVSVRKSVALTLLQYREKRLSLAEEENLATEAAQDLQQQASSLRKCLQDLASEKMTMLQELNSTKQRMEFIEKRSTEIDTEKRLAAAARNFKAAGRLSSEAKAMSAEREAVALDITRIELGIEELEKKSGITLADLEAKEEKVSTKQIAAARARYERLRLLASSLKDERDAAAELEDFEEAESLQREAEAADAEADEIQKVHGSIGEEVAEKNPNSTMDGNRLAEDGNS